MRLREPVGAVRARIAAAGDLAVIGATRKRAQKYGYDRVFATLAEGFRGADLAFLNLEMPIAIASAVCAGRSPEFWQESEVAPALARAGVHVVSLANNHVLDCGAAGLVSTRAACEAAGLLPVGAGANLDQARTPARLVRNGVRILVLAYGSSRDHWAEKDRPGIAPLELELVRADLERWRSEADVLVVSAHWGSMYVDYPPPRVLELGRALAQSGADLVLGHHPHVLQGFHTYGRTLVLHSLGDACFDSRAGDFEATIAAATRRQSAVFTIELADTPGLVVAPLKLDDDGVPEPVDESDARALMKRLTQLSEAADATGDRFRTESAPQLLRYELQSFGHYVKSGQIVRAARLVGSLRPRHLPLLWQALRGLGRTA
jgi:poly-gamma-glutamate capsule biosynthesis protein CapA/YwtB (metallophosphatase superfamily)